MDNSMGCPLCGGTGKVEKKTSKGVNLSYKDNVILTKFGGEK